MHIARELEDDWGEAFAHIFLGWSELEAGNRELATTRLRAAVRTEALGPIRGTGAGRLRQARRRTRPAPGHPATRSLRRPARAGRWPTTRMDQTQRGSDPHASEQQLDPLDARRAWDDGSAMTRDRAADSRIRPRRSRTAAPPPTAPRRARQPNLTSNLIATTRPEFLRRSSLPSSGGDFRSVARERAPIAENSGTSQIEHDRPCRRTPGALAARP